MTPYDAARILSITGTVTAESLKEAYRKACKTYHPDLGGSDEMMKIVNSAHEVLKAYLKEKPDCNFDFSGDRHEQNYPEELNEAIKVATSLDGILVEIAGAWLWVSGDTRKHKDTLKAAGFMWAPKKERWYFRPKNYKSSNRKERSIEFIKDKYGMKVVKKTAGREENDGNTGSKKRIAS